MPTPTDKNPDDNTIKVHVEPVEGKPIEQEDDIVSDPDSPKFNTHNRIKGLFSERNPMQKAKIADTTSPELPHRNIADSPEKAPDSPVLGRGNISKSTDGEENAPTAGHSPKT